jgi:hypothetical protein
MNLPSQDQVNSAAKIIGSFLGGLLLAFGLTSKISPDAVTAIVNATSGLVNDVITLIGLVSPIFLAYFAAKSASQTAQVRAVQAMPGVEQITVNAKANPDLAVMAASTTDAKVVPTPEAAQAVAMTAKSKIDQIRKDNM